MDRAYPNVKPDWFTDIYCHTCKIELGELVPETCLHAMVTCPMVRTARTTFLQHLNIAVTPIDNLPGDIILTWCGLRTKPNPDN